MDDFGEITTISGNHHMLKLPTTRWFVRKTLRVCIRLFLPCVAFFSHHGWASNYTSHSGASTKVLNVLTGTQMTICFKKCQKGGGYAVLCALLFLRCVFFEGYNGKMMMNHQISGLQIPAAGKPRLLTHNMRELSHPGVLFFPTSCCGVLFFLKCTPGVRDRLRTQLCHTQVCHRHNSLTHTQLCHRELFHAPFFHSHTHNFVTHTRTQTQLCHTELCHTHNSFTHKTLSQTALSQTTLSHTTFPHTTLSQLCHAHNFVTHLVTCTAGVALTALGWLWWRAWSPRGQLWRRGLLHCRRGTCWHARSLCVAGVAFGDVYVPFTQQAWHFGDIDGAFVRQAWHVLALTCLLCGRCGSWW